MRESRDHSWRLEGALWLWCRRWIRERRRGWPRELGHAQPLVLRGGEETTPGTSVRGWSIGSVLAGATVPVTRKLPTRQSPGTKEHRDVRKRG